MLLRMPRLSATSTTMQSARRAVRNHGKLGNKLPQPFTALENLGAYLRQGQVSLVVAAPGGGKTAFALNYALKSGIQTLYISADLDIFSMGMRTFAIQNRAYVDHVESLIERDAIGELSDAPNIAFGDDSAPSIQDIVDEVRAWVEIHGEFPPLLIVDNLINVQSKGESVWHGVRQAIDQLHELARTAGIHVMVLGHATGQYGDGTLKIPLSGIEHKPGNNCRLVLTIDRASKYVMNVRVVKNNGGKADGEGNLFAQLFCDLARMDIDNLPAGPWKL